MGGRGKGEKKRRIGKSLYLVPPVYRESKGKKKKKGGKKRKRVEFGCR